MAVHEELDQQYTSGNNALYYGYTNTMYLTQGFTAGITGKLTKFSMHLKKVGNPGGNTTCYLTSDNGSGKPQAILATINTLANSSISSDDYAWYDFEIAYASAPSVTSGTAYHVMLGATESATDYILVRARNSDAYEDGFPNYASDELVWSSLTAWDCDFKTYVTSVISPSPSVSPSLSPSASPSLSPSASPSISPSISLSVSPSPSGAPGAVLVDSYSESNMSSYDKIHDGAYVGCAQSFESDGGHIQSVKFYLSRVGSPTGNATAKLYAHSGTFGTSSVPTGSALTTSGNVDVSGINQGTEPLSDSDFELTTFTFSDRYEMVNGTRYVIALQYSGGDVSNFIAVAYDSTSPTHEGNASCYNGSSWSSSSNDMPFYLYRNEKYSASPSVSPSPPLSASPSVSPSISPSASPSPSLSPSFSPSQSPSPSLSPSYSSSYSPSASLSPSVSPSAGWIPTGFNVSEG